MNEKLRVVMAKEGLMPLADAARATDYDETHLRRLVREARVEGKQVGGRWWFVKRTSLVAYVGPELAKAGGITKRLEGEPAR